MFHGPWGAGLTRRFGDTGLAGHVCRWGDGGRGRLAAVIAAPDFGVTAESSSIAAAVATISTHSTAVRDTAIEEIDETGSRSKRGSAPPLAAAKERGGRVRLIQAGERQGQVLEFADYGRLHLHKSHHNAQDGDGQDEHHFGGQNQSCLVVPQFDRKVLHSAGLYTEKCADGMRLPHGGSCQNARNSAGGTDRRGGKALTICRRTGLCAYRSAGR